MAQGKRNHIPVVFSQISAASQYNEIDPTSSLWLSWNTRRNTSNPTIESSQNTSPVLLITHLTGSNTIRQKKRRETKLRSSYPYRNSSGNLMSHDPWPQRLGLLHPNLLEYTGRECGDAALRAPQYYAIPLFPWRAAYRWPVQWHGVVRKWNKLGI